MPAINPEDFSNAKRDVDHIAALATSSAPAAIDRFGRTKKTWTGLEEELGASYAITQTGINRAASEGAAVLANAERQAADAAAMRAETARDAAQLSSGTYPTQAAGLAAVAEGRYFTTPSADAAESLILYRKLSGAAVEVVRYPSASLASFGWVSSQSANYINFDTVAKHLIITGAVVRLLGPKGSWLLPATDIAWPAVGMYRLEYNTATGLVQFTPSSALLASTAVPFAIVRVLAATVEVQYLGLYTIDGVVPNAPPAAVFGWVAGVGTNINFSTTTKQLVIVGSSMRLYGPVNSYVLPETILAWPAIGSHRLEYSPAANTLQFVGTSAAIDKSKIIIAIVRVLASSVIVSYLGPYAIDGVVSGGSTTASPTDGTLIGDAAAINFDWPASLLRIAGAAIRGAFGAGTLLLSAQDVALPATNVWHRILLNTTTGALTVQAASAVLPVGVVAVGTFQPTQKAVAGIAQYYVNGVPAAQTQTALTTVERLLFPSRFEGTYVSPDRPDFKAVAAYSFTDVYALYDALVTAYPSYVSRSLLGKDGAGNDIFRYDFKPAAVETVGQSSKFPKLILVSSIHGYEKAGVYVLYLAMKSICEGWRGNETLEALRWNAHFIVVPVAVPFGFNAHTRKNESGVDVARNFPTGWVLTDPAIDTYGGPTPLSEKSSQYLDALMSTNRDALYFGSFHNFFTNPNPNVFVWNASATRFGVGLAKMLLSLQSRRWKTRFAWLPQDEATYLGYVDAAAPAGSEAYQATHAYEIQAGTFEIGQSLPGAPDSTPYSQYVATMGCELVINWLTVNLVHGAALLNTRAG